MSPASTSTTSPTLRLVPGTIFAGSCGRRRRAAWPAVSVRVRAQRVGLGLAAAFGDRLGEVGEQHGEPQPEDDLEGEAEVAAAGDEVAEEQDRGQQRRRRRRRTSPGCWTSAARIELAEGVADGGPRGCARSSRLAGLRMLSHDRFLCHATLRQKVWPASIARCSTIGPRASAGKKVQAADDQDDADEQADEQRAVGREGAGGGGHASSWRRASRRSPAPAR